MASKTFVELYTDGLTQADELTGASSAAAKTIIKTGINESYAEIAGLKDWDTLTNSTSVSAAAGTEEYTPITGSSSVCRIRRIQSITDTTNNRYLNEVKRELFIRQYPSVSTTTDRGTPTLWYVSGYTSGRDIKFKLYLVPNSAATLKVLFTEEPLELSADSDVPRIPDQWHYGLSYLGLAKYFEYQQDPLANYYRSLHDQYKKKVLDAEWGETDEMPQMTPETASRGFVTGKIGRVYN